MMNESQHKMAQEQCHDLATNLGFNDEQKSFSQKALAMEMARMEQEDPNEMMSCSCCGDLYPAKELDVFGLHYPYSKILTEDPNA